MAFSRGKYKVRNLTKEKKVLSKKMKRDGESDNEWIALNITDNYEKIKKLFPYIENSVKEKGEAMHIGPYEFLWRDNKKYKKATSVSSHKYISLSLRQIKKCLGDTEVFAEKDPFPKKFKKVSRDLWKKMFRCYGYFATEKELLEELKMFKMDEIVIEILKNFLKFTFEFRMLKKGDLLPMNEWILDHMGNKYAGKLRLEKKRNTEEEEENEEEADGEGTGTTKIQNQDAFFEKLRNHMKEEKKEEKKKKKKVRKRKSSSMGEQLYEKQQEVERKKINMMSDDDDEEKAKPKEEEEESSNPAALYDEEEFKQLKLQKKVYVRKVKEAIDDLTKHSQKLQRMAKEKIQTIKKKYRSSNNDDDDDDDDDVVLSSIEAKINKHIREMQKQEIEISLMTDVLEKTSYESVVDMLKKFYEYVKMTN